MNDVSGATMPASDHRYVKVNLLRDGARLLAQLDLGQAHRPYVLAAIELLSQANPGRKELWSATKRMAMVGSGLTRAMTASLSEEDQELLREATAYAAQTHRKLSPS